MMENLRETSGVTLLECVTFVSLVLIFLKLEIIVR